MEIYNATGVLKTGELKVNKSIGSLIVSSSRALDELTNEIITIWIERANGSNVPIATNIPLVDFIMLSVYGGESVQSSATLNLIAVCEIAPEGSIRLFDGESLKFKVDGLLSTETYAFHGVEEPISSDSIYQFETKTVASEDTSKKLDVAGYDLAIINTMATIDTLSYQYGNKEVTKFLPFEIQTLSRDIDPIQYIASNGSVSQSIGTLVTLPLIAVNEIEVQKVAGTLIKLTLRTSKNV